MSETQRRLNNRDKALALLQRERRVSNARLVEQAGFRAGARVFELRKQGYRIRTEHGHDGLWWFIYEGEPLPPVQASLL